MGHIHFMGMSFASDQVKVYLSDADRCVQTPALSSYMYAHRYSRVLDDMYNLISVNELGILASNIPCEASQNFDAIITYLRELYQTLLSEVCTLASLILVMPATNAVSERSFSALRRLKTYLRSTTTQTRLNNIKVLHIHHHLTYRSAQFD